MGGFRPGDVWETLRQRVREWMDGGEARERSSNEDEADPSMLFHLSITAPLLIAFLILTRQSA